MSKEKKLIKFSNTWINYAWLIREVSQRKTPERAEKCGYDLFMGLSKGDAEDRYDAWKRFLKEPDEGPHTDAERDGAWVPAVEVKFC